MRYAIRLLCMSSLLLAAGGVPAGWSQEIAEELALKGPRFLLASASPSAAPLRVDVSRTPVLRQRISLELEGATLDQALAAIKRQSGLQLIYSSTVVPLDRQVYLKADDITVAGALTEVLLDTDVDVLFSKSGKAVLVRRTEPMRAVQDTGTIVGQVTDKQTGKSIAGASVEVRGTAHTTNTGEDGRYRIAAVLAGMYTVRVRYIGYAPASASVTVSAGQEVIADFALVRSAQPLDEVVTTGTIVPTEVKALPTPITVIGAEEIAERHPVTMVDVIRQAVPSAVIFESPVQRTLQTGTSVRGVSSLSAGSQIKIFVDGIEAASTGVSPVDPNSIERVEIIRGPQAATLYGADAAGGVLQIFTKRGDPSLSRPQVDARTELGIAQTPYPGFGGVLRQSYAGSVRGGHGDLGYNFGGSYARLADWIPNGEGRTRQSIPSVYGGMHFGRGIITANLSARYYRNRLPLVFNPDLLTTGFVPFSRPQYLEQDWINETYGARITVAPTGWWRNQLTVGADRFTVRGVQTQPRVTTPADTLLSVSDFATRKISIGYNASVEGNLGASMSGSLTAGLDHYEQDASSVSASEALRTSGTITVGTGGLFNVSSQRTTNTGYFAQVQGNLRETIFLTAGLRAETSSTFGEDLGTPVLPRVGVSFVQPVGQTTIKLRGSYGKALRVPLPGLNVGVVTPFQIQLENPVLGPEKQSGWDAGVDLIFGDRGSLSVSGYDQNAEDLLVNVQVAAVPVPTFEYQNVGLVANSGIEIEGQLNLGPVRLKGQYAYVHSEVEDLGSSDAQFGLQVGDRPFLTPEHTAGAGLTLTPWAGTTITGGLTYVGSYRSTDIIALARCIGGTGPCTPDFNFTTEFPGFAKVNAAVTQRLTRYLEGFVSVDNLNNNESFEGGNFATVMGRITMVGLHLTY